MPEREVQEGLCHPELAQDLRAAEDDQVGVLGEHEVDALAEEQVGQLRVGLVGRDHEVDVLEGQEVHEQPPEALRRVLRVPLESLGLLHVVVQVLLHW